MDNGKERADQALELAECEVLGKILGRLMDRYKGKSNGQDIERCIHCGGYLDRPLNGSADSDVNSLKCHSQSRINGGAK